MRYEFKSVQAIRGLEARSKAKWEKDGWELVEQAEGSLLHTTLTFRRPKKQVSRQVLIVAASLVGAAVIVLIVGAITEGGETPKPAVTSEAVPVAKATPTATATPVPTPVSTPTTPPQPESEPASPSKLDQINAAQFLALQWQAKFQYGGTVHWITDCITTTNPDGTFTFKMGATVKNQYGTDENATIEGDVGGTDAAPVITDSILYTDDGSIVNFNG